MPTDVGYMYNTIIIVLIMILLIINHNSSLLLNVVGMLCGVLNHWQ